MLQKRQREMLCKVLELHLVLSSPGESENPSEGMEMCDHAHSNASRNTSQNDTKRLGSMQNTETR